MRALILVAAVAIAGCAASSPPSATKDAERQAEEGLGKRAHEICALPPDEQKAALEKLMKETGFVLYCGRAN